MKFFSNSAVNRVYMHAGLQSFATNCGGAFIYVYLLKAGISLPIVFVIIATIVLSRLLLRLAVIPTVKRIGLRQALILGSAIDASSYLVLGQVKDLSAWLVAYIAVAALGTTFYWTCYHAMMSRLGDEEHRGSQVSAREAIFAITAIIGPLVGGAMLTTFGPFAAFAVAAIVYACAILPLLGLDRMDIPDELQIPTKTKLFAVSLPFADGLVAVAINMGWKLVLFQTLKNSFEAFGGALAIAGLVGAAMGLGFGRLIDLGHHKRTLQIGIAAMALTVLAEALGYNAQWTALAATMLSALAVPVYMSSIMSPFYNVGKASGCTLRFNAIAENGFDVGAGMGCLFAAVITWAGFGVLWLPILGLTGCFGAYFTLRKWNG